METEEEHTKRGKKSYKELYGPYCEDADTCDMAHETDIISKVSKLKLLQIVYDTIAWSKLRSKDVPDWTDLDDAIADHIAAQKFLTGKTP